MATTTDTPIDDYDLATSLADNDVLVGNVSGVTKRFQVDTLLRLADARIWVTGGAGSQVLSTSFEKVTQFNAEASGKHLVASHTNDQIQIPTEAGAGVYRAVLSASLTLDSGSKVYLQPRFNGVEVGDIPALVHSTHANEHQVCWEWDFAVAVMDQYVELRAKADAGTPTLALKEARFRVFRER